MRTTTITCDRCGVDCTNTAGEIINVGYGYAFASRSPGIDASAEWCRKCVAQVIGHLQEPTVKPIPSMVTTSQRLEMLIREMAREEAQVVVEETR